MFQKTLLALVVISCSTASFAAQPRPPHPIPGDIIITNNSQCIVKPRFKSSGHIFIDQLLPGASVKIAAVNLLKDVLGITVGNTEPCKGTLKIESSSACSALLYDYIGKDGSVINIPLPPKGTIDLAASGFPLDPLSASIQVNNDC